MTTSAQTPDADRIVVSPSRTKTVSGREVRWYRIPHDRVLRQAPSRTHRVEAKIERFSNTLWIVRVVEAIGAGGTKDMPSLEAAEEYWRTWIERRTERRW